jgi:ribosomal protein S18 acetylase RimI-like enzyme
MVEVRFAHGDDIAQVVDLWDRAGGPTRHPGRHSEAQALIERDPEALMICVDEGRLLGTLIVGWDGWRCHLYRLAVDSSARRQGIARELTIAAHARARRLGAVRVDAMIDPDNLGAVAFWESVGYVLDRDLRWSLLAVS